MARSAAAELDLRGGHPAIDLVNTVAWRGDAQRRTEYLSSYADLVAWARHTGVLSPREARALADRGVADDDAAAKTLRRTRQLREALHSTWTGCGSTRDADEIADAYRPALRARRLAIHGGVGSSDDSPPPLQPPLHRRGVQS